MRALNGKSEVESAVAKGTHLVLFHATWCPFCRSFKPVFEAALARRGLEAFEALLGGDGDPVWSAWQLEALPTAVVFRDGRPVERLEAQLGVGIRGEDLERWLDRWLPPRNPEPGPGIS